MSVAYEVSHFVVGGYRVVERTGATQHGVCYVGECTTTGRGVSIEVFSPEHARLPNAMDAYFSEMRLLTSLRHPGLVEVLDLGFTEAGRPYLVSELLAGQTLGERLAEVGTLSVAQALAVTRKLASALAAAHARGIAHRDLAPESVFLVGDDVKLLGFGRARLYRELVRRRNTPPPRPSAVDHRTDLHGVGRLLFEMLIGRRPDGNENQLPTMLVPPAVGELAARLLSPEPALRPRSAALVAAAIDGVLVDLAMRPPRELPPVPRGRIAALAVVVVTGLLALCAAGVAAGAYLVQR